MIDEYESRPKIVLQTPQESVEIPYDHISIYHDGENCPIPSGDDTKNKSGAKIFAGVLQTALIPKMKENAEKVEPFLGRSCKLVYSFVHPTLRNGPSGNAWHISAATLRDLQALQVTHVSCPDKKGSVDLKIKELIKKDLDIKNSSINYMTSENQNIFKAKQLFVIISGDSDFADDIQSIRGAGYEVDSTDIQKLTCNMILFQIRQNALC